MPSNVLVSGLSDSQFNGLYAYDGNVNGKPSYNRETFFIRWTVNGSWTIIDTSEGGVSASSDSGVAYPWLAVNWYDEGLDPTGLVMTEVPVSTEPTFGLPADVVALITSRFGTVANFLRLRNQGQI